MVSSFRNKIQTQNSLLAQRAAISNSSYTPPSKKKKGVLGSMSYTEGLAARAEKENNFVDEGAEPTTLEPRNPTIDPDTGQPFPPGTNVRRVLNQRERKRAQEAAAPPPVVPDYYAYNPWDIRSSWWG